MITNAFQEIKERFSKTDNEIKKREKRFLLFWLDAMKSHRSADMRSSDFTLVLDCLLTLGVVTEEDVSDYIYYKHSDKKYENSNTQ
jgi:hypothetical protein